MTLQERPEDEEMNVFELSHVYRNEWKRKRGKRKRKRKRSEIGERGKQTMLRGRKRVVGLILVVRGRVLVGCLFSL